MLRFVTRFNERQEVVGNGGALCPEMGAAMRLGPEARQLLVYERAVTELALPMEEHGATEGIAGLAGCAASQGRDNSASRRSGR
jgi:hypothetical protein